MSSDQCQQYKKDYEKLLALKQEFDAVLAVGEEKRDFTEAKMMKNGFSEFLEELLGEVLWSKRIENDIKMMRMAHKDFNKDAILPYSLDKQNRNIIFESDLNFRKSPLSFLPNSIHIKGHADFSYTSIKKVGKIIAEKSISFVRGAIEEINGDLKSNEIISFSYTPLISIQGNIETKLLLDLRNTLWLVEITGEIKAGQIDLIKSGLKELPANLQADTIFISRDNTDLIKSAQELIKTKKVKKIVLE